MRLSLPSFALGALLAACGATKDVLVPSPDAVPGGLYAYEAYTMAGAPLLSGTMLLDVHRDASVTGTWSIGWVPGADTSVAVGPQVGAGMLRGSIENGMLLLDLNPGWADNNVFLSGTARNGAIVGTWGYSTLVGAVSGGSFVVRILRR